MAPPPFPPKPKIGPLVRRSLFAATIGVAGCHPKHETMRIGPPPRIGAEINPYDDGDFATPPPDAGAMAVPADAAPAPASAQADAGAGPKPPPPIRIGPPVRIGARKPEPIRIGAEEVPNPLSSSLVRGIALDAQGQPLAQQSLRIELPSGARIVSTDASGAFSLDGLPPGSYDAVVRARGLAPVSVTLTATRTSEATTVTFAPAED